jgi:hypothetical protein
VSERSYLITLSNNRTEKAAVDYLLGVDSRYRTLDAASRGALLDRLGIGRSFSRAFDLVRLPEESRNSPEMAIADVDELVLVELKTTRKRLPELPKGFFFGATENEFELARRLGDRFRFCFVCLHPETPGSCLLTLGELEARIRTRRIQYQINL